MVRILETIFAGLLGLAFGSFLNVCLSRWPEGESVVAPRSHCRNCEHTLAWWENIPLLSWLALRGRCRNCHTSISWRYPLVEMSIAALWAIVVWQALHSCQSSDCFISPGYTVSNITFFILLAGGKLIFCWLMVALAILDAENLWLPDFLTLPGAAVGFIVKFLGIGLSWIGAASSSRVIQYGEVVNVQRQVETWTVRWLLSIAAAAVFILLIRWVYWLIRRQEGIGLGDVKLMVLLAVWLSPSCTLLAFVLGIVLGASVAVVLLIIPGARSDRAGWALTKLPLGTFLCIGGIVSGLWGEPIVAVYRHWAGF